MVFAIFQHFIRDNLTPWHRVCSPHCKQNTPARYSPTIHYGIDIEKLNVHVNVCQQSLARYNARLSPCPSLFFSFSDSYIPYIIKTLHHVRVEKSSLPARSGGSKGIGAGSRSTYLDSTLGQVGDPYTSFVVNACRPMSRFSSIFVSLVLAMRENAQAIITLPKLQSPNWPISSGVQDAPMRSPSSTRRWLAHPRLD